MSETEFWIGKVKKVIPAEGETVEEMCARILSKNGKTRESYYDTALEQVCDDLCDGYVSYDGGLYDISGAQNHEYEDICKATIDKDGDIEVVLKFYNGGTCFSEMFSDAMKELEESNV